MQKLSRRQFLKLAGATGVLAVPSLLGYEVLDSARGELPPSLSCYAPLDVLEQWPSQQTEASPILLLVHKSGDNPFGLYLAEILRAEGLNCFQIAYLSDLSDAPLDWYDMVLLAEGPLASSQADLLTSYVAKGGRLVAMRPDARLAPLFGLEPLAGGTAEGYLQVEPGHPVGQGIARETLQFHGVADHYRLAGAQAVAWLATDANTLTDFPAVTLHRYGQGQTAVWAFDLAHSVAYMRQGNPTWANQERDGGDGVRAPDMFRGWIDLERILIPQADQQQRLLINLLSALSQDVRPLPRLWYFPGAAQTMLIATGDSHGNPGSAIEEVLGYVEQRGGHFSVYYTAFPSCGCRRAAKKEVLDARNLPVVGDILARRFTAPIPSQIASWRARGHEFGLHPYVEEGLDIGWDEYWREFTGLGYGPVSPTVRTHRILWKGWVETARAQAAFGMRMNLDYYHWGPAFREETGEWVYGHFTGSGLPMKFVDEQGRILNIYQQLTQIADDHLLSLHWGGVAQVSAEAALEVSRMLLRRSLDGDYCAIVGQFHVDPFAVGGKWVAEARRWLEGTLDYAVAQAVPIWSAADWLHFTETRHDAKIENVQWQPNARRLSFKLVARTATDVGLTAMVPFSHDGFKLVQLEVDGSAVEHKTRTVGGVTYGWISVPAGSQQVVATYA
jgi:hypothetical protein